MNDKIKSCLFNYAKSFEESMWNNSDGMIEFSDYDSDNLDSDYQNCVKKSHSLSTLMIILMNLNRLLPKTFHLNQ